MFSCFAELGFYRGAHRREGKGRGGKLDMEDKEAIPDGLSLAPGHTSPAISRAVIEEEAGLRHFRNKNWTTSCYRGELALH